MLSRAQHCNEFGDLNSISRAREVLPALCGSPAPAHPGKGRDEAAEVPQISWKTTNKGRIDYILGRNPSL